MKPYRLAVVAAVLMSAIAMADDFDPPAWRGLPGTTFQEWTFSTAPPDPPTNIPPDEGSDNPFGQPVYSSIGGANIWVGQHLGRDGVWRLSDPSRLEFDTPNLSLLLGQDQKAMSVQVTHDFNGVPEITIPGFVLIEIVTQPVPPPPGQENPDWFHTKAVFLTTDGCPSQEVVTIKPPGEAVPVTYVDQVVIDTYCMGCSPPCPEGEVCVDGECVGIIPTVSECGLIIMALLALTAGTIVFARRRRPTLA